MIQRRHGHAPTLENVAARAGVSRATAGRVLTGGKTSEQARDKVLLAAEDLGYVPNRAARALVTRRSDAIAFVVAGEDEGMFGDPFFPPVLRGVQATVAAHGLQLIFTVVDGAAGRRRLVNYAAGGHLDGAVLAGMSADSPLSHDLKAAGVPVAVFGRSAEGGFYVDTDNFDAATAAVRLLVSRGCRRIATITGPLDAAAAQDRLAGYRRGLAEAGLGYDGSLVVEGDFGAESGRSGMQELLLRAPDVDAVFAASDLMAIGALRTLADAGRAVPADVAVVGFDDITAAAQWTPRLTTVRTDPEEVGRQLAIGLISTISGNPAGEPVVVATRLVLRESA